MRYFYAMTRDYTVKKPLPQSRYGRLSVIKNAKGGWLCRCDCGAEKIVRAQALKTGATQSCGCYKAEVRHRPWKHGMTYKPIYRLWVSMIDRCTRPNVPNFKSYGARGIKVCERWQTFENFYADMGDRPDGKTLDRIDQNGNYELGNCRWATHKVQARNRRDNRLITMNGETKPLIAWCESFGLSPLTVSGRLRRGATLEAAFQPVAAGRRPAIKIARTA